jgi:hypothetical protein
LGSSEEICWFKAFHMKVCKDAIWR